VSYQEVVDAQALRAGLPVVRSVKVLVAAGRVPGVHAMKFAAFAIDAKAGVKGDAHPHSALASTSEYSYFTDVSR
jgi:hypothetical protein